MPQPTPSDVHVNQPLTNISVAFLQDQEEFISDRVFPNIPVPKNSDRYFQFPKGNWFRTEARERGLSQESAGSGLPRPTTASRRSAISGSPSTRSATPAATTEDGIPGASAVLTSCTTTVPPAARTALAPARPSLPPPVSTTARAADPNDAATEVNSVSTVPKEDGSSAGRTPNVPSGLSCTLARGGHR